MLDTLRKHASGGVAQIFIALLVLSFAVWGISDIFRGFNADEIARVGDTPITVQAFQRAYQNQLNEISAQIGQPVTPDQSRGMGLPGQVLGQLVSQASITDQAEDLGLGISREKLSAIITSDPMFSGGSGFSRTAFNQVLRANGLTEGNYMAIRRTEELRVQLVEAISGEVPPPDTYQQALHEYRNESRTINYLTLDADDLAGPGTPSEAELANYFAENRESWRAPEYRALTIVRVEPSDLARPQDITDEEAEAVYQQRKSTFGQPEQRRVSQVVFSDATEANAAAERIAAGETLGEAVGAHEVTELGLVTRDEMVDAAIAEAAFSLEAGETSGIVEGRFGPVVVKVDEIVPADIATYEEVADEIKQSLADRRAVTDALDEHDRIEDARAGGASLSEIAADFGLPLIEAEAVDATGAGPDGEDVADIPVASRLVREAFNTDVGIENDPLQTDNGGFVWYQVDEVMPTRERELSEVRDEVVVAWQADQIADRLQEEAEAIAEEVRAGSELAEVAAARELEVSRVEGVTRVSNGQTNLPGPAIQPAFSGPVGTVAVAPAEERYHVVEVAEVEIPEFQPGGFGTATLAEQMSQSLSNDLLQQYLAELQSSLGVTVNQAAVQQIVGGSAL